MDKGRVMHSVTDALRYLREALGLEILILDEEDEHFYICNSSKRVSTAHPLSSMPPLFGLQHSPSELLPLNVLIPGSLKNRVPGQPNNRTRFSPPTARGSGTRAFFIFFENFFSTASDDHVDRVRQEASSAGIPGRTLPSGAEGFLWPMRASNFLVTGVSIFNRLPRRRMAPPNRSLSSGLFEDSISRWKEVLISRNDDLKTAVRRGANSLPLRAFASIGSPNGAAL